MIWSIQVYYVDIVNRTSFPMRNTHYLHICLVNYVYIEGLLSYCVTVVEIREFFLVR